MKLLDPMDLIIQVGSVTDSQWLDLEKPQSLHGHRTIDHLGSIHFSYAWLCN